MLASVEDLRQKTEMNKEMEGWEMTGSPELLPFDLLLVMMTVFFLGRFTPARCASFTSS